MKRVICFILSALMLLLCSCEKNAAVVAVYRDDGMPPSYMCRLYPEKDTDTKTAYLLRRFDDTPSSIAVSDAPGSDMTVIYELPEGSITYEITAGDGIVAFYELSVFTDGSVRYELKVIDTANGNEVHTPYSKTVSENTDSQTRFIYEFNGCVYYLTRSSQLQRCRVMRYDVAERKLDEYLSYDFTENTATNNSSCTFISGHGGYLTCGAVEKNRNILKTYELYTGELVYEKQLPYSVAMVFMADHDPSTGLYALYYISAQGKENVAVITRNEDEASDILTLSDTVYVGHESVHIINDLIYFELQDTEKTKPYEQFTGMTVSVTDFSETTYPGALQLYIDNGSVYTLKFDKRGDYGKISLLKAEIK